MSPLEGKRIIVTGGAQGIGASAVRAFARDGARVASLDVVEDLGERVAAEANQTGPGDVSFRHCDVSQRTEVQDVFADAVNLLGGLDALVHVAGVERAAPAEHITDEDWDLIMNVNLRGTFLTNQAAFPYLKKNGGGRIINFGSGAALDKYPNGAHYSASKAGVISWTRTIAAEWGKHGITAVVIAPAMWTGMYDAYRSRMSPQELAAHDAMMAGLLPGGGKLGNPDTDLAPVLVFLVSDAARFITAQIIPVDGGLTPVR